jgi:transposase
VVTDHDTGRVGWIGEGHTSATLTTFYDLLGEHRRAQIQAVTMDMTRIYHEPTLTHLPHAAVCFDPFHVIKWAGDAVELAYQATPRPATLSIGELTPKQTWQKVRTTLRQPAEHLDPTGWALLRKPRTHHPRLWRAWNLKERLRDLYRTVPPDQAATHLNRWITAASRAASNASNAIRTLARRRAHGYANLDNLIEMIYLCHGGVPTPLPTETH